MGAIGVHHTETSDGPWDGTANRARLRTGDTEAYYRQAFAWQDPDGDPTTKSAYRFIHHDVASSGDIGAANLIACSTGIGVLNGARVGTTIPDGDYRGVWSHLAAHLRDGDQEPPALTRSEEGVERTLGTAAVAPTREQRVVTLEQLEIRAGQGDAPTAIIGYAAVFNKPSQVLSDGFFGAFREYIAPGAFRKTLSDGADVRALVNHNPDYVLGRTKSGTLKLVEDAYGLRMEITPPATRWAEDLITTMQRGDIDGSSFGFQAVRERWGSGTVEGREIDERYVLEARLFDVSVVTFPAYPQTESQVRSLFAAAGLDMDSLARAIVRGQHNKASPRDVDVLRAAIEQLRTLIPNQGIPASAPIPTMVADHARTEHESEPDLAVHPLSWYRDRLAALDAAARSVRKDNLGKV